MTLDFAIIMKKEIHKVACSEDREKEKNGILRTLDAIKRVDSHVNLKIENAKCHKKLF